MHTKNLQFIVRYSFGTLGVLHCQQRFWWYTLKHEETIKFCDDILIIFHLLISFQVCSAGGRWTFTVASLVFFHTVIFIYGGQQNENWVFIVRLLGTLPCRPRFLPSCHAANCKPILNVDLSLCACKEELAENRNIYYAQVLIFLDSLYQTDFSV